MADTPGYVSNSVLAQRISELVDRWNRRENQMIALLTQPAGEVTVTDGVGVDHTLPSFLQLSADVAELVNDLTGSVSQASDFANNARLYAESAQASSQDAAASADTSAESAQEAGSHSAAAASSATASADTASASASYADASATHASASAASANASAASANDADQYATRAADSRSKALASENAASALVDQADAAVRSAEGWTDKSRSWATNAPGIPVEDGEYSARHWAAQAQASVLGSLVYMGSWDASTGSFPQVPVKGHFWKVGVAGRVADENYNVGDQIVYDGSAWDKIDNTEQVTSVAGKQGAVALTSGDIGGLGAMATKDKAAWTSDLSGIPPTFPPSSHTHTKGDVGLSNVDNTSDTSKPVSSAQQAALNTKASLAGASFTGTVGLGGDTGLSYAHTKNRLLIRNDDGNVTIDAVTPSNTAFDTLRFRGSNFLFNAQAVWHGGNFNPATKADLAGASFTGNVTAPNLIAGGSGNGAFVQVGDDARLVDVGKGHTAAIQSTTNGNVGFLQFGTGGALGWDGSRFTYNSNEVKHTGNTGYYGTGAIQHSDWNSQAVTAGVWMATGSTNSPDNSSWWLGYVSVHNGDWIQQEVVSFTEFPPRRYKRHKAGGTWQPWRQMAEVVVSTSDPGGSDGVLWIQP
ncbi:pyocin knob domain-containing protein [Xanthomonas tesorieronis]|uniref:pyocin knob domain-containing protein n=1 Tax=Xanthomonas tesorieronis TaxID=3160839 RepID=UPI003516EDDD